MFPAGPFRRRAASIRHPIFRQQPFCTSLQDNGSKAVSRNFSAKRCLTEPISTGPAKTEAFLMEPAIYNLFVLFGKQKYRLTGDFFSRP